MGNRIFLTVNHTVKNRSISMLQVNYLQGLVSQLQEDVYKSTKLCVKKNCNRAFPDTEENNTYHRTFKMFLCTDQNHFICKNTDFHTVESTSSSIYFRILFTYVSLALTVTLCMESRNRPSVAQRIAGGLGSQISMTFGTWRWWGWYSVWECREIVDSISYVTFS